MSVRRVVFGFAVAVSAAAAVTVSEAAPLSMASGLRASCADLDLPAAMDQAVRAGIVPAGCGAAFGGMKWDSDGLDPDRALWLDPNAVTGESSQNESRGSGSSNRGASGGGGGGGAAGAAGSPGAPWNNGRAVGPAQLPPPFADGSFSGNAAPPPFVGRPRTPGVPSVEGPEDPIGGEDGAGGDGESDSPFAVPEPTTLLLLGAGLALAAARRRRH